MIRDAGIAALSAAGITAIMFCAVILFRLIVLKH